VHRAVWPGHIPRLIASEYRNFNYLKLVRTLPLVLLSLFVLAGCATSTVESRKKERTATYASLPPEQKELVDQGKIKIGMTPDAVYLAWGAPAEVLEEETPEGQATIWVYQGQWVEEYRYWIGRRLESDYYPRNYIRAQIFFRNGVVSSWRTLPRPVE
jgi:hypothetical protein